jgi:hypothetical protein
MANEILGLSTSPVVVLCRGRPRHLFELHHQYFDVVADIKLPLHDNRCGNNIVAAAVALVYKTASDQRSNTVNQVAFLVLNLEASRRGATYRLTPASHAHLAVERFLDVAAILAYSYCARPAYLSASSTYFTKSIEGQIFPFNTFTLPLRELSAIS